MQINDLSGKKFGKLTVLYLEDNGPKSRKIRWVCKCECGKEVVVQNYLLLSGNTKSCGCLRLAQNRTNNKTHGMSRTPIYRIWGCMIGRCNNPTDKKYPSYGGRGIKVCDEWRDFTKFYTYVSKLENFNRRGYSLDRIDNNGDYRPNNVRWVDSKTQGRNKRNNHFLTIDGQTMTIAEAAERYRVNPITIISRIEAGDTGLDLVRPRHSTPHNQNKKCRYFVEYNGQKLTLAEAAKIAHVSYNTMRQRFQKGGSIEDLFRQSWYERKKNNEKSEGTMENGFTTGTETTT